VFKEIVLAGLKVMPILSFHQLGGNVGDVGNIPIPEWIWTKYIGQPGVSDADSLKYLSEQGRTNSEYVSVWGTRYVITDYIRLMAQFQNRYSQWASDISAISIGLGPTGELRYPSYNAHDHDAGYGTRGSLQSYSPLATQSWRNYIRGKYNGDLRALNQAWGTQLKDFSEVAPPQASTLTSDFFAHERQFSPFGRDYFNWYNQSLLNHGETVLASAIQLFNAGVNPGFRGIPISAKFPGIHWRVASDRLAELTSGIIRARPSVWGRDDAGHGYAPLLNMFKRVYSRASAPTGCFVDFTALEMDDGRDGPAMGSMANTLVKWIGDYAWRIGLRLKGENALAEELSNPRSWDNLLAALEQHYTGVSLLRLDPLLESPVAANGLARLTAALRGRTCRAALQRH
jgi:hypothetical protein